MVHRRQIRVTKQKLTLAIQNVDSPAVPVSAIGTSLEEVEHAINIMQGRHRCTPHGRTSSAWLLLWDTRLTGNELGRKAHPIYPDEFNNGKEFVTVASRKTAISVILIYICEYLLETKSLGRRCPP